MRSVSVRVLLVLLIVSAGFAGCSGDPPAKPSQASASGDAGTGPQREAALQTKAAANGPATADDWFQAGVVASPEGTLAGFRWTIPAGAAIELENFFGDKYKAVFLEVAPVATKVAEESIENWALSAFRVTENGAQLVSATLAPTFAVRDLTPVLGGERTQRPFLNPFFVWLQYEDLAEGDTIGFVVAAQAKAPTEFGLALRILDEEPGFGDSPSEDYQAFMKAAGARASKPLQPAGTGSGFQLGFYLDYAFLGAFGAEFRTPAMTVEDRLPADTRPISDTRDLTLSTSMPGDSGWGLGVGIFFGDKAVGTWSYDGTVRDQDLEARSVIATTGETPDVATYLLFGFPFYYIEGDGSGPSTTRYDLKVTNHGIWGHTHEAIQFDLGAPLQALIGASAAETFAGAWTGLLGNVPPSVALRIGPQSTDLQASGGPTVSVLGIGKPGA